MSHGKESSLRKQLIAARVDIMAQLEKLELQRTYTPGPVAWIGGHPDYRSVIAELEGQLSEIDALLGAHEEPGP